MPGTDIAATHYNRVLAGLALLALVLIAGTAGYMLIEGWSFLDALYMAAITITTVGYREVQPLSTEGQLFTIGLLFLGVGAAFYILTTLIAAIIEGDLRQVFGARRMKSAVNRLRDHYIVCGFGRVGQEVARELRERDTSFVVVDRDPAAIERAVAEDMLVLQGDATADETLLAAGLESCRALIAASDSDATNTFITLTARALRSDVFVVARVSSPDVDTKLRQAGASRVVSPYSIGGRRLALAAIQPIIADFLDVARNGQDGGRIIAEIFIDRESGLAGKDLNEALSGCRDAVVLAVRDSAGRYSVGPPGSTRLAEGHQLIVVGDEDELSSIGGARMGARA